ncbi:MAG: hypothetical protein CMB89_14025 [Flammeovirgaceae bacterium]|nr:hypothetical protein [Flammeovirgaceae bacterium]
MGIVSSEKQLEIFQEIFHNSPGVQVVIDCDNVIVFTNQSSQELFNNQDLIGQPILNFIDEIPFSKEKSSQLINGFPYSIKSTTLTENFRALYLEPLFRTPDPENWFTDISDFFREPMWVINEHYQLVNYNEQFKLEVEKIGVRTVSKGDSVLYPEYPQKYLQFWQSIYNRAFQGEEITHEFERPDQASGNYYSLSVVPIVKNSKVIGVACFTKNITDFKRQNEVLMNQSQKLKKAFGIASMSEWEYDFKAQRFTWIEGTSKLLGIESVKLPTSWTSFIKLIHPDHQNGVKQAFETARASKFLKIETKIRLDQKNYIWIKLSGIETDDSDQNFRLIGIIQNINSRKLAELQLIESETRYRELISVAPAIIFQYNISTDTGIYYSGKPLDILGYTVDEMIRNKEFWTNKIHPEDYKRVAKHAMSLKPGDVYVKEYRVLHKRGNWVWVKEYSIDVKEVKGQIILTAISFDITKEKEYEIRLNLALESSNLGVWEHHLVTDEFILDDKMLRIIGYTRDELPSNYQEVVKLTIHPDEQQRSHKIPIEVAKDGMEDIIVTYNKLIHKNGNVLYIESYAIIAERDDSKKPIKVIGTVKDVTEKRLQEIKLFETNQTLQKIIESVPGVVFRYPKDDPTNPDFISDQIFEITGYHPEEIHPKGDISFLSLVNMNDAAVATIEIEKAYQEQRSYQITYRLKHKSGRNIWIWERGGFVKIEDREFVEGFMTDITDKVKAEDRIILATLKAEDSERSRISREIHDGLQQTLVSSLFSFQEFGTRIEKQFTPELKQLFTNALETLQNGVAETRMIAHSIMPKSIQDFGLIETLEYMIEGLNRSTITSFKLYHNISEDNIRHEIATSLYRICQEATNNILKYAKASEVEIQLIKHDNSLIMSIDDNGIGFDTNKKDLLYAGLGFSSMRSRANAISATFDFNSTPGKGTSIVVETPLKT